MKLLQPLVTWLAPAAATILIWGALFLYLADSRKHLVADGETSTADLAQAFEESLVRTIREVDQTLLYVRALRDLDGKTVDLKPWIDGADPENRLAAQLAMADRHGLLTVSNLLPVTTHVDLSDRPHFRHFADHPDDHLFISAPVLGRVSNVLSLQFVRMLKDRTGSFDGIIVLSMSPDKLVRFQAAVDLGRYSRITVTGLDGIIRARAGSGGGVGAKAAGPLLERAMAASSGHFRWIDPQDGIARIVSFRRLSGYPLIVSVSRSEAEMTAEADRAAPGYLLVAVILTWVVIAFAAMTARQRRAANAARQLTALAMEHVGVGIMVVSPFGRISMLTDRAREILALPPSLTTGVHYDEMSAWQRASGIHTPSWHEMPPTYRCRLPDGRMVEMRSETLPDGVIVHSFTDVTAAEQAQRSLTEARDAAEAAVSARARFLAAMSHEIRTPLNGILGVNELLRGTSMTAEQVEYAGIIQQAGEHLLEMLTEILDYSKIDQQGVVLERVGFDPVAMVRDVAALLRPRATTKKLQLIVSIADDVPRRVLGDPHRVRQVLFNLVGNAIKFTLAGRVSVFMQACPSDDTYRLRFTVSDTGIGIEPQAIRRLFQEFTQTDGSITRRFGGTGLGLAICRRLVEAMDGAITVDSVRGEGSTFQFEIPVGLETTEQISDAGRAPAADFTPAISRRAPLVLVAEDSQVNQLVARRMLERLGCRVQVVEDGRAAVEAVQAGGIDLVLMDVMMPDVDGLAATRAIRGLAAPLCALPIIGLSANAFRSDEEAGRASGMTGFITKPVDQIRLATEISAALKLSDPLPPRLPVPAALHALCETLGPDTTAAVIEAFRGSAPAGLVRLRAAAQASDAAGVAREAHALAGSAGALGLDGIRERAAAAEVIARRDNGVPDRATLDAFAAAIDEALTMLAGTMLAGTMLAGVLTA